MDWIANMPGPQFLGLYAAVIATVLVASFLAIRAAPSGDGLEPVVPASPDPYEMAYLRGGEAEITKLMLIELARDGYIQESMGKALRGGQVRLKQTSGHPSPSRLSAPLRQVFELIGREDKPLGELMKRDEFRAAIAQITSRFEARISREGLLVSAERKAKVFFYASATLFALGGYKLVAALMNGRYNVEFLILFYVAAMVALWAITRRRLTPRGSKYFRQTQEAYRGETSDVVLGANMAHNSDMLLHVGLFGAPILFGTAGADYATMLGLDPNRNYGSSGCGSSCGSSCSGGGSGCGGGGCGGCGGGGD